MRLAALLATTVTPEPVYLQLRELEPGETVAHTFELTGGYVVDVDKDGRAIGLEWLGVSHEAFIALSQILEYVDLASRYDSWGKSVLIAGVEFCAGPVHLTADGAKGTLMPRPSLHGAVEVPIGRFRVE